MPTIYIPKFDGVIPLSSGRLLPDGSGQLASNVNLVSGEIKPLRKPKFTALPTKPSPFASIYFARNDASTAWMTWTDDVDVVRAPLPADVESRYYWSGDGEPRYGTFTNITNGGANDYPKVYYSLGVPTPQVKPVVSVTGGVGTETSDITTVIATSEYALTLTTGYEVVDMIYLRRDGTDLTPSSERAIDMDTFEDTGSPTEFYLNGENKVVLVPTPDAVETLTAKVVITPKIDATTVPDSLLTNQHIDAIAAGAKSILQLMDGKPWSDPTKAAINHNLFEDGIAGEAIKLSKGGIKQPIRTTGAYF